MRARLLRGIGANLYGQVITLVIQIISVPLLIKAWGPAQYGSWVLLSAIPTALALADGGLVLASGNAMTLAVADGDVATASRLFRRSLQAIAQALTIAAALAGTLLLVVPAAVLVGVPLASTETRSVLGALTAVVLLGVLGSLPGAVFRADGRYAFGVAASQTVRLFEGMAILLAGMVGGGLLAAALTWLAARLAGSVLLALLVVRRVAWTRTVQGLDDAILLRPLLRPALASLAVPASFVVSLQGVSIAVGLALPPEAVATFSAVRTLTRAMVQVSGLVNHALMPEMTRVVGQQDRAAMVALARFNARASLLLLLPGWIAIVLCGPALIAIWTGGRLHVEPLVLPLLATAALVHGFWLSQANLLLAVNRQGEFAWMFLAAALATALLALPAAGYAGLPGAAGVCLSGECVMAVWLWLVGRARRLNPVPAWGNAAS